MRLAWGGTGTAPAETSRNLGPEARFAFSAASCAGILTGVALLLRLASLMLATGSIDWEGAEYARLAENLASGAGYVGLDLQGKNLMFPPLFPVLIAAVSKIVGDAETAARLISVATGTATVPIAYLLGRRLAGIRAGLIACAIMTFHPLMVHFSAMACTETTFIFLMLAATCLAAVALERQRAGWFAASGALFGLAYLTRVEGAPLAGIAFLAVVAVATFRHPRAGHVRIPFGSLWLPVAFLVLATPYIAFLHSETGQWRLEGKSPLNIETAMRVISDKENLWEVHYGVSENLEETGVWIGTYTDKIARFEISPRQLATFLVESIRDKSRWIAGVVTGLNQAGRALGAPLLTGLALLGLMRASVGPLRDSTTQSTRFLQIAIAGFLVLFVLQLFLIVFNNVRFLLSICAILIVWAAVGADLVWEWVSRRALDARTTRLAGLALAVTGVAAGALASNAATRNSPSLAYFNEQSRDLKQVARSLAAPATAPARPMLVGNTAVAFYANADYIAFPFADAETALRYFDKRAARFVSIESDTLDHAPYLEDWWRYGIPDDHASLISEVQVGPGRSVRLYSWTPRSAGSDIQ